MPITQGHIAQRLGLNQKTVSIAFGAAGRINPATRERILQVAKELGYRPNRLASGLRGATTHSIGVIWAFVDPWAGDAVIGLHILEKLQQKGFATYQSQHSEHIRVLCMQLDDLLNRRVDAIILQARPYQLVHPEVRDRLKAAPAMVAVTREPIADFGGDLLVHDRNHAIEQVVDHFAATGRRRPAMLLSMGEESGPPKYEVFAQRCRHHGLAHADMLMDTDYPRQAESYGDLHLAALRRRWPDKVGVDAIFCFNDVGALYVMRELQDRRLDVPRDVAVVGFNDIAPGRIWRPALASGNRKFREVAETVDQMLERRLADPSLPPQRQTIHMEFIRRESAG